MADQSSRLVSWVCSCRTALAPVQIVAVECRDELEVSDVVLM